MNIARMEKFENLWAIRHDLPAESLAQYRFESREGYRLPELAAHYRTFVDALDSVVIHKFRAYKVDGCKYYDADSVDDEIEDAGLKVAE